jgi:hypothetical protein
MDVEKARVGKQLTELAEVLDRESGALDPHLAVEAIAHPVEERAILDRQLAPWPRLHLGHDRIVERQGLFADRWKRDAEDGGRAAVAEAIRDPVEQTFRDRAAACGRQSGEAVAMGDDLGEGGAVDRLVREGPQPIEAGQELLDHQHTGVLGHHAGDQRRAAASRGDDEAIHARPRRDRRRASARRAAGVSRMIYVFDQHVNRKTGAM